MAWVVTAVVGASVAAIGATGTAVLGAAAIGAGASLIGSSKAAKAQKSAAKAAAAASQYGTDASIAELKAAREESRELRQPFIDLGSENISKLNALAPVELQPLPQQPGVTQGITPIPGMEQLDEINPVVAFLREQGFDAIQESAAAHGRLGAGGTLKDLAAFDAGLNSTIVPQLQQQRFNQGVTQFNQRATQFNQGSTLYNQVLQANNQALDANQQGYNQLYNLVGMGSNASAGQATAALNTGTNVANVLGQNAATHGNAAIQYGKAQADNYINTANAVGNFAANVAPGIAGAFPSLFGTPAATPIPSDHGGFGLPFGSAANSLYPDLYPATPPPPQYRVF